MRSGDLTSIARRARWAVAAFFLVNGFIVGSWAPQIPVFLTRLEISEFTLGLLILGFGLGALGAMPYAGYLLTRYASTVVVKVFAAAAVFGLPLVALAPGVPTAAIAMVLFGGVVGGMDVAMNANAVAVERRLGRAIMSSSHGFWSLGGFAGGAAGGIVIQTVGHLGHALAVGLISAIVLAIAQSHIAGEDKPAPRAEGTRLSLPRSPVLYLVGVVALFSMIPEGAVLDWSALYLRQELGAGIATAGFAFALFSGAMALMRFAGDGIRNRYGAVTTMRVSSLIAAAGILAGGLAPWASLAILAFGIAGLGVANMVPIAFSAAGNQPGLSPGAGMSVVTTMGYSGILLAPSGIGFVAQQVGLAPVFIALSLLLLVVCALSPLVASADFRPAQAPAE